MKKIIFPTKTPVFSSRIEIAGNVFRFDFRWNTFAERWAFSVTDNSGAVLWQNIFAATGVRYDLLFPGLLPEGSVIGFIGNEKDPDMENFFLVVIDAI